MSQRLSNAEKTRVDGFGASPYSVGVNQAYVEIKGATKCHAKQPSPLSPQKVHETREVSGEGSSRASIPSHSVNSNSTPKFVGETVNQQTVLNREKGPKDNKSIKVESRTYIL